MIVTFLLLLLAGDADLAEEESSIPKERKSLEKQTDVSSQGEALPSSPKIDVLPTSPVDRNADVRITATQTVQQTTFSGPLPPPQILQGYERIEKGMASRIVGMAEANSAHVRRMETLALLGRAFEIYFGQFAALLVVVLFLSAGTYLAMNDHAAAGVVTYASVLVGIVTVFIKGRAASEKEEEAKHETPQDKPSGTEKTKSGKSRKQRRDKRR